MKDVHLEEYVKDQTLTVATMSLIVLFISSCASMYTENEKLYDITKISAAEKENGLVVKISAAKKIGTVEAWIGDDNWLYITIPDTNIDFDQIMELEKNPMFVKMEYFKMNQVIQLSLQMKKKADQLEVVRYPDYNDVYIALYKFAY